MHGLFTYVLIKFFTERFKSENKGATQRIGKESPMFHQIKAAAIRSNDTLLGDAIGGAALIVMLVVGLFLPGLV